MAAGSAHPSNPERTLSEFAAGTKNTTHAVAHFLKYFLLEEREVESVWSSLVAMSFRARDSVVECRACRQETGEICALFAVPVLVAVNPEVSVPIGE